MRTLTILSLLATVSVPSIAIAQDAIHGPVSSKAEQGEATFSNINPLSITYRSADGSHEAKLGGRLMVDYGTVTDKTNTPVQDGFEVRSARVIVEGKVNSNIKYKMIADFAGEQVKFKDVSTVYSGNGYNLTVGQSKEPISQDGQAGKTNSTFMENSSVNSITGLTHQLGVAVDFGGDNWGWKSGIYGGSINDDELGAITVASRAVYGGNVAGGTWGVAGSLRFRNANDHNVYNYELKAFNYFSPNYLDVGVGSQKDVFYGADVAYTRGPFHAAVEYGQLNVRELTGVEDSLRIDAGYVEAGYFLTDDRRDYDLRKGKWGFSQVANPVAGRGTGAVQVVARYDIIDMSGKTAIAGGNQKTLVLGVNWFLSDVTRFVVNYNNSKIKNAFQSGLNDDQGKNSVNGLALRLVTTW